MNISGRLNNIQMYVFPLAAIKSLGRDEPIYAAIFKENGKFEDKYIR